MFAGTRRPAPGADSIVRGEPEPARHQGALGDIEEPLHEEREQGRRPRALEHEPQPVRMGCPTLARSPM